jgi:hypothetical protein
LLTTLSEVEGYFVTMLDENLPDGSQEWWPVVSKKLIENGKKKKEFEKVYLHHTGSA